MSDDGPGRVSARWVLLGFAVLAVATATAVFFISRDTDERAKNARALEEKLGRKVGPQDSPPKKPGLFSKSSAP